MDTYINQSQVRTVHAKFISINVNSPWCYKMSLNSYYPKIHIVIIIQDNLLNITFHCFLIPQKRYVPEMV